MRAAARERMISIMARGWPGGGFSANRKQSGAFTRLIHPNNRSAENERERFIRSWMTCGVRGGESGAFRVVNASSRDFRLPCCEVCGLSVLFVSHGTYSHGYNRPTAHFARFPSSSNSRAEGLGLFCCFWNPEFGRGFRKGSGQWGQARFRSSCGSRRSTMKEFDRAGTPDCQRRSYHRFHLKYPVRLTFRSGESVAVFEAASENVSKGGILLKSPWMIPLHTMVSLTMRVQGKHLVRPIRLVAEGKIVRVQADTPDGRFLVAVQFTRPVTEIEAHIDYVLVRPPASPKAR